MTAATSLWSRGDRLGATVLIVAGATLSAAAWIKASGKPDLDGQLAWADLGVAGLVVAAWAQVMWFRRGRLALALRRSALLDHLDVDVVIPEALEEGTAFVAGPDLRRYHRPDCPLAVDRNWPPADRRTHEDAGRRPCGVCRPGMALVSPAQEVSRP